MTRTEWQRIADSCERRMNEYWRLRNASVGAERRTFQAWFVREHQAWCRALERA